MRPTATQVARDGDLTSKKTVEGKMIGEAEIRDTFAISARGQVLVLEEGFFGTIPRDGIVESDAGRAAYTGPDFLDSIREGKAWVAVRIDPSVKALFAPGQRVKLYTKR